LILVIVLEKGHAALAVGKHRTGAHTKHAATASAGMHNTWCENSGQQTTTDFYRCRIKFLFHFQSSKLRDTTISGSQRLKEKFKHLRRTAQATTAIELSEAVARRRRRRLLWKRIGEIISRRHQAKLRGRDKNKFSIHQREFQSLRL